MKTIFNNFYLLNEVLVKLSDNFEGKPKENIGKAVKIIKSKEKTPIVRLCKEGEVISGIIFKYQTGRYYKILVSF